MSKIDKPVPEDNDEVDVPLLTLADLEKAPRRKVRPAPFTFGLSDGTVVHFADPEDLDWQEVADVATSEDIRDFFFLTIPDNEELEAFFAEKILGSAIGKLVERYRRHYNLVDGRGNSRGSRRR